MEYSPLVLLALVMTFSPQEAVAQIGLQYPGPMYAGGVAYSKTLDQLMVTGSVYGLPDVPGDQSNCFVAAIAMDGDILNSHEYGEIATDEACSAIAMAPNGIEAFVAGGTQPRGYLTSGATDLDMSVAQLGMILQLNDKAHVKGFGFDDSAMVQYPVAIVADSDGQHLYVASMAADNGDPIYIYEEDYPDLTSGGLREFGSDYHLVVEKYRAHTPGDIIENTIAPVWDSSFRFENTDDELGGILVSSMIMAGDGTQLVITGSTRESGGPFGENTGTDMDGWIIKMDPSTGDLYDAGGSAQAVMRVDDSSDDDDWINAVCVNPVDSESIYIVGATDEPTADFPAGSLHAFVAKLHLESLTVSWTAHLKMESVDTPPIATAVGCAVTSDGSNVYVVGNTGDGTKLADAVENFSPSHGKVDAFVVQLDENSGHTVWARQVGSEEDDRVARGNPIALDSNDNAIIFGDTYGTMFEINNNNDESNGFLMSFSKVDGSYLDLLTPESPPVLPAPTFDALPAPLPILPDTGATLHLPMGLQYPGPMYAAGVAYSSALDQLMLTGTVFGLSNVPGETSNCFVTAIAMDGGELSSNEYGESATDEACSAITWSPDGIAAYVAGGTQPGGFLTADADLISDVVQYGMILQVNSLTNVRGYEFDDVAKVQYPVAIVADPSGDYIYAASMVSDNGDPTFLEEKYPDLTSGGHREFGRDFYLVVEKYRAMPPAPGETRDINIIPNWYATFRFDETSDTLGGILVSSMVLAGGGTELIIVGSTRESGGPFGENTGTDMDGWIIKVDPETGDLYDAGGNARSSMRVDDSGADDDWINAVCVNPVDPESIYIVGATDEPTSDFPAGSLHAYVAKLHLESLTVSWTTQIKMESDGAPPLATARGCAVTSDGSNVYVVGDIGDGAKLADAKENFSPSHGKSDIFVVQFDESSGDITWARQVGSEEDDRVAHGNPIAVDAEDRAIVFGDTYGSMFESNNDSSESNGFLMSFSRTDGTYKALLPPSDFIEPPFEPIGEPDDPELEADMDEEDTLPVLDDVVPSRNFIPLGLQYPGPMYSGGLAVASNLNRMMVTGSVYGLPDVPGDQSNCFVASISMDGFIITSEEFGESSVDEACSAIALSPDGVVAYIAGGAEAGGYLTEEADLDPDVAQYGMILQVNALSQVRGYGFDDDAKVQYPVAIVTDPSGDYIYVASMASDNADPNFLADEEAPDLTSGGQRKYGSDFHLVVEKYRTILPAASKSIDNNIIPDWYATFRFDTSDEELGGILVSSMVLTGDGTQLVVAGSTRESGGPYGVNDGTDMDGWVIKIDSNTGDLYDSGASTRASIRVDDAEEADDWINAVCADPLDADGIYVVGATDEDIGGFPTGSLHAFVAKLELSTLTLKWRVHLPMESSSNSPPIGTATGCEVTPDGSHVYVVGNTGHDTIMLNAEEGMAHGKIDFFVTQLDPGNGHVAWMRQVGTKEDDRLARGNPIASDADGNAVVLGDTYGSMFEYHDGSRVSDGFIMSFSKADGSYEEILDQDLAPGIGDNEDQIEPPTEQNEAFQDPEEVSLEGFVPENEIAPHEFVAIGIQYTGPAYAGGVVYDASLDRSIVTGSTYGMNAVPGDKSDCYVATVSMNSADVLSRELYGTGITDEACSAIAFSPVEDAAYVVGGTETNGFLTGEADLDDNGVQYGMILQVNDRSELRGFGLDDAAKAQYPVAIVTDPNEDFIYVASMVSNNADINPPQTEVFPDWTSGGQRKYGSNFHLVVEKFLTLQIPGDETIEETIIPDWYASFEFDDNGVGLGGILVSSMVLAGGGNELVIVGSTRESGGPFGVNDGTDMDGWIIKLDSNTGDLSEGSARSSVRVDDAEEADDWVNAVCVDRFDQDSIYIVGSTDESMPGAEPGSTHAFVAKLDLADLTLRWRAHLSMESSLGLHPQAAALGCVVAPDADGGKVYVVGNIRDGGRMLDALEPSSHGKDDIFVAQFDATHGQTQWIRQAGSAEDDRVANGNPIALDADGNAIVFGETYGNMYHDREGAFGVSDVFLMTFSKVDGTYKELLSQEGVPHHAPDALTGDTKLNSADAEEDNESFVPDNIVALQTGPDVGPSYAGGMVYDKFSNAVYLTGATYGSFGGSDTEPLADSSCFFGVVMLPKLQWKEVERYGHRNACSALSLTSYEGKDAAIVVGSTEDTGVEQRFTAKQVGFAMDLANIGGSFEFAGVTLMDGSNVQYPVSVVTEGDQVWVVSMASEDTQVTADFEKVANNEYPNFTTGGVEKYGSRYSIVLEKFSATSSLAGGATLVQDWKMPMNDDGVVETIFVSQLLRLGDDLVIVGSMEGAGKDDMDGIMIKASSLDGTLASDSSSGRAVSVFDSESGRDDWLMNACADPADDGYFYVVGATKGRHDSSVTKNDEDLTVHAVMAKIELKSLTTVWTQQYSVKHASGRTDKEAAAAALGCDVIPGENLMYVAGVVENSATIQYRGEDHVSAGGDDIFISLVSTEDGSTRWLRQVGSNGDDRIARGGGVSVDANKNAVVFGDTNGSLFRDKTEDSQPQSSDIFVMLFDFRDGTHMAPLEAAPIDDSATAPKEWYPTEDIMNDIKRDAKVLTIALSTVAAFVCLVFCCCAIRRQQRQKKLEDQTASVFTYLKDFDVDDVDLRRSPPGGWHGIYLNKLAYGINRGEFYQDMDEDDSTSQEKKTFGHSSIVSDSLFMDAAPSSSARNLDEDTAYEQPRTFDDEAGNMKPSNLI